jgi:dCMP deaminase
MSVNFKPTWIRRFLSLAIHISSWSKDTSTIVGAVIVNEDKCIVSVGFNGAPRGIPDDDPEVYTRPTKYFYTEHAERNAIYNANRINTSTLGCTMFVTHQPCADCARAIIQAGIKEVYYIVPLTGENWVDSVSAAEKMFQKAQIKLIKHE